MMGALSLLTYEHLIDRPAIQPPFDASSLSAINEETDVDPLRARAHFYFGVGRDLKRAPYAGSDSGARDFRIVCFLIGGILVLGGALTAVATRPPKSPKM